MKIAPSLTLVIIASLNLMVEGLVTGGCKDGSGLCTMYGKGNVWPDCDAFAKKHCQLTCNTCPAIPTATNAPTTANPAGCRDTLGADHCDGVRRSGRCYSRRVEDLCEESCGYCPALSKDCKDTEGAGCKDRDCDTEDAVLADFMEHHCQQQCKWCFPVPVTTGATESSDTGTTGTMGTTGAEAET